MKFIITILLLVIGAFAQNTKYKDGTDCNCDSIHRIYDDNGILKQEITMLDNRIHGMVYVYYESGAIWKQLKFIQGKPELKFLHGIHTDGLTVQNDTQQEDSKLAYWYNKKTSSYCTIKAITPSNYIYDTFDRCDKATTSYKWAEEFRETLKIKACKGSFTSSRKSNLYEYLDKCIKYTTIENDSPNVSYMYCGVTSQNSDGTASRPSSCQYGSTWFTHKQD